jgi:hypothetical protein
MHLRYGSQLSTINGVCGNCDYSIKWLILQGNVSKRVKLNLNNPTIAERVLDNEREVLRS